jgi:hypothetical protein
MASHRRCATALLLLIAATAGMLRQELGDEASRRLPCWTI